jgi:hypothetical protein
MKTKLSGRTLAWLVTILLLTACLSGGGTTTTQPANTAPAANAGSAQSVATGDIVALNGSASTDVNNDPLIYAWTLTTKPASSVATFALSTSAQPTFTADVDGVYIATLIVNDSKVNSAPATTSITAAPGTSCTLEGGGMTHTLRRIFRIDPTAAHDHLTYPNIYPTAPTPEPYLKLVTTATSGTPHFSSWDITITQSGRQLDHFNFAADRYGADAGYTTSGYLQTGISNIIYLRLNDSANLWFSFTSSFTWMHTYSSFPSLSTSMSCVL